MLDLSTSTPGIETIRQYIPNYHINLIDASRIDNLDIFQTDLQLILGMLQYRGNKDALVTYVNQHKDYFSSLDKDTYYAVQAFLNCKKQLMNIVSEQTIQEGVDMCKALDDLYNDGKIEGKIEGIQELILKKYKRGLSIDVIADFLEITADEVMRIINQTAQTNK